MSLLLTGAAVAGRPSSVDVRIRDGRVTELGERLAGRAGEQRVDAVGGALLPGLHDHHLHLLAMAAAAASPDLGPGQVDGEAGLRTALAAAAAVLPAGSWLRAVGYAESVAGPLDRDRLDAYVSDRPVRVQHRSGALWMLNSAGVRAAGLDEVRDPGVERDSAGRVTGRLWRWDRQLRSRIPPEAVPDLGPVSRRLAAYGITGVTDATPDLDPATLELLAAAVRTGTLRQELTLLGMPLGTAVPAGIRVGPYKLLLADHDLPPFDDIVQRVGGAHGTGRAVAVHCVTRESLLLTLAALEVAGPHGGDRIEHAAVVPPEARERMAALGVRAVTQPGFLADRGDDYLRDVDPDDRPLLYPYASLCAAGVPVAASSDAPYGPADPWQVIAAAADRTTPAGAVICPAERVTAQQALSGYLSAPSSPGGPPRTVAVGTADLVLLDRPLEAALADPAATRVRLTLRDGLPVAGG